MKAAPLFLLPLVAYKLMALMDVIAGFPASMVAARRDFGLNGNLDI